MNESGAVCAVDMDCAGADSACQRNWKYSGDCRGCCFKISVGLMQLLTRNPSFRLQRPTNTYLIGGGRDRLRGATPWDSVIQGRRWRGRQWTTSNRNPSKRLEDLSKLFVSDSSRTLGTRSSLHSPFFFLHLAIVHYLWPHRFTYPKCLSKPSRPSRPIPMRPSSPAMAPLLQI